MGEERDWIEWKNGEQIDREERLRVLCLCVGGEGGFREDREGLRRRDGERIQEGKMKS